MNQNPPSVEESLAEPTPAAVGRRIAKNLHIVVPLAVCAVLGVVMLLDAVREEDRLTDNADLEVEREIRSRSNIEMAAPGQVLADQIAQQRRIAEEMEARDRVPETPLLSAPLPPPAAAANFPPVPQGRPQANNDDEEKNRLRMEQVRTSGLIALQGNATAQARAEPTAAGGRNQPASIESLQQQAEDARRRMESRQDQIIAASNAANAPRPTVVSNQGSAATPNQQWLDSQSTQRGARQLVQIDPPGPRAIVHQGAVIPAVLVTEINSDMPGQITAMVTMDVFDSIRGDNLMIPKGSRIIGSYNTDIRPGQERVMAAFQRIIRPDGSSMDLGAMVGGNAIGQAGLNDQVNNHFWRMFSSSFLIAGVSWLFDRNQPDTVIVNNTTSQSPTQATGQILQDIAKSTLERNRTIPPTLIIRSGHKLNILVNRDIAIPPYAIRQ